ncbi:MAG: glycosyltransferase [Gemmatimonadota bacterium]|nr:glycosyltransferase [Gemmatimonadota bacterium]
MKASIIVPVLDAGEFLPRSVPSWLEQEGVGEYEVILVDNGSTDEGLARIPADPRIRVLVERRRGAYSARNRGAAAARGDTLVFTDPDCVAERDWLALLLSGIGTPGIELVIGRDRSAGDRRSVRLLSAYDDEKERWIASQDDPSVYFGHTNNMTVSRTAWDASGPFEERWLRGGDTVFVQKVLSLFGTRAVEYHPRAVVHHLEVACARDYFEKCRVYGRSSRSYGEVVEVRSLTMAERWRVYRSAVRRMGLGPGESAWLLALLTVGMAHYWWGRNVGRS